MRQKTINKTFALTSFITGVVFVIAYVLTKEFIPVLLAVLLFYSSGLATGIIIEDNSRHTLDWNDLPDGDYCFLESIYDKESSNRLCIVKTMRDNEVYYYTFQDRALFKNCKNGTRFKKDKQNLILQ